MPPARSSRGGGRPTVFERQAPPAGLVDEALDGVRDACFWLEDVGDVVTYPVLTAARTADLLVVGGGYTGLWTAVKAKVRNPAARVVLLEAQTVGWAASGRNGGFCDASLTHGEDNGRARWPDEYDTLERLGQDNLESLAKAVDALGIDCELERTGSLDVAVEPYQVEQLLEGGGDVLDAAAVRAEVDSPTYLAGVWHRDSTAMLHPAKLVKELARVATGLGVEIFENSSAESLETSGRSGPVLVRTPRGSVRADRIALATNVFPSLLARTRLLTVPVYDYALMTEPLSQEQRDAIGWHNRQGVSDMANQFHYYRITPEGRILFGGYDAVYHYGRAVRSAYEDRPATYRTLASHFLTTFPQLEGIRFTHRWAGAIDTSTQFCAFHGLAKQGRVAYTAGFTGLGVAATHFAADVMLDRLSGERTPRTEVAMVRKKPLPFPPEPAAAVGINLTRWSLDRADHREGHRNIWLRALDAAGLGFDS
ncbi:FAD-binding oxidoreductase [Mumia sp. zg.B21]|uniref:NAD(P)/FAD-dependent oxidoreductase n=1 Tax=Mumia sp. zg.B21 TaxID=2855447 RepID=UPI001C6E516A|nr:FAD-dependent oxidoreductase [Mumia sp. zg.B21]MBW9209636.1 FAD-binding oxidoreductase [Mumia sp. zg.B21]